VSNDLRNADGIYMNESVVVDENLVKSRFQADLPDLCRETLRLLGKDGV
jgi:putative intracellular protease/amidase